MKIKELLKDFETNIRADIDDSRGELTEIDFELIRDIVMERISAAEEA